ncbi:MAG: hypothetical protein AAGB18_07285, partial [Pseudomonadota bacterium]
MSRSGLLLLAVLLSCIMLGPFSARADQHGAPGNPIATGTAAIREMTDARDIAGFLRVLDGLAPAIMQDPRLSIDDRVLLLGGISVLASRFEHPEPEIQAESWLLAYAEVALGPEAEIT